MLRRSRILIGLVIITVLVYLYLLLTHQDVDVSRAVHAQFNQWSRDRSDSSRVYKVADRYCNYLDRPVTGLEGRPFEGYHLEQVQLLIRHGDRSPMHSISEQPKYRLNCAMDLTKLSASASAYLEHLRKNAVFRPRSAFRSLAVYPKRVYCDQAQLTPTGVEQHIKLGKYLRKIYIDEHRLLNEATNWKEIYVKSTKYSRTYQSASAFLFGFLPKYKITDFYVHESPLSFCNPQLHSCRCPLFTTSFLRVKDHLVAFYSKDLKEFFKENINSVFPSLKVTGIRGTVDALMGPYCHALPICNGCNVTKLLESVWHVEQTVRNKLKENPTIKKLQRLYLQPFLYEIALRMRNRSVSSLNANESQRFILYSGHDVTISAMMVALGLQDNHWPPYASRMAFELYRNDENKYFFRVLFNGNDVTSEVRFCRHIRSGDLCDLKLFLRFIAKDNFKDFNAKTYGEACLGKIHLESLDILN